MIKRLLRSLLVGIVVAVGLAATTTPAANAAISSSCAGNRVSLISHYSDRTGDLIARTGVYRSTGKVCFITNKAGVLYGESSKMDLTVWKHVSPTNTLLERDGPKNFTYYAGAATVADTGCIWFNLAMWARDGVLIEDYGTANTCW